MSATVELSQEQMDQLRAITMQKDISVAIEQVILEYLRQAQLRVNEPPALTSDYRAFFELAGQDVIDPDAARSCV